MRILKGFGYLLGGMILLTFAARTGCFEDDPREFRANESWCVESAPGALVDAQGPPSPGECREHFRPLAGCYGLADGSPHQVYALTQEAAVMLAIECGSPRVFRRLRSR